MTGPNPEPELDGVPMVHVDGVPWWDSPVPRRWHRCRPQTTGQDGTLRFERCACGAVRLDGAGGGRGPWIERNSRSPR